VAFPYVPSVVRARLREVDLLPRVLAHVVHVEARCRRVGIEGEAEGVAEAPGERLLAAVARRRPSRDLAASGARALERVRGRDERRVVDARPRAVHTHAEHLAEELELVAGRVVVPPAAGRGRVVAAAVADRDVEVAVLAEGDVPRVVVPVLGRHVVHEHQLGGHGERVAAHREARHAVDAAAPRVARVEEVDVAVAGEERVRHDAEQPPLGVRADLGGGDRARPEEDSRPSVDAQRSWLRGHEHPAVRGEGHVRGRGHGDEERVLEAGGDRGPRGDGEGERGRHGQAAPGHPPNHSK
jgi:hypothetical protein